MSTFFSTEGRDTSAFAGAVPVFDGSVKVAAIGAAVGVIVTAAAAGATIGTVATPPFPQIV